MTTETSSIQLPPPRRNDSENRRRAGWYVWVVAALVGGIAAGVMIGKNFDEDAPRPNQAGHIAELKSPAEKETDRQIEEALREARDAVSKADWVEIRDRFDALAKLAPDHPELRSALPLIELHMVEALGGLVVTTVPEGAIVKLGSQGEAKSRAQFNDVPFGTYTMEVNLPGFEPYVRKVKIAERSVQTLEPIELVRMSGSLTLSSEPNGVEFILIKTDGLAAPQEMEIIESGTTPKLIEKLDPGEYEVKMLLKDFPNFEEKVSVENNRKSSVSHVFAKGGLKITSDPDQAEIFLTTESSLGPKSMGKTPAHLKDLPVGKHALELHYKDWPVIRRRVEVSEGEDSELNFEWPRAPIAFTSDPPGAEILHDDVRIGAAENLRTPFTMEFPEGEYTFTARYENLSPVSQEMEIGSPDAGKEQQIDFKFEYGSIVIQSSPPGASVLRAGMPLGRTPFSADYVLPGTYSYELRKPQHRAATVSGDVNPGQSLQLNQRLIFDPAPKTRSDFTNTVGVKMIWIENLKGWVGAHEVNQKAFEALMSKNPSEFKGDDFPVHGVSWNDVDKFCTALNNSEGGRNTLPKGYEYRMPSDREWSEFVGEAKLADAVTSRTTAQLGPLAIGSKIPNEYGLYDVRGNVWEWCNDWYTNSIRNLTRDAGATPNPSAWTGTNRKVLRGGSWARSTENDLDVGYRNAYPPVTESREVGFRVVLMPTK